MGGFRSARSCPGAAAARRTGRPVPRSSGRAERPRHRRFAGLAPRHGAESVAPDAWQAAGVAAGHPGSTNVTTQKRDRLDEMIAAYYAEKSPPATTVERLVEVASGARAAAP